MQKPGKSGRNRGLVDGTIYPDTDSWHYKRPHAAEMEQDGRYTLSPTGHSMHVVQWCYKGKTVDFALVQQVEEVAGNLQDVAKYDCCHSEVHKHQYHRDRGQIQRNVIVRLSDDNHSWEKIDRAFDECYEQMLNYWDENYRRWGE